MSFGLSSAAFLGHIISSEGVEVDSRKTQVVKNLHRQLTPIDIMSFLDLPGYYLRFVDSFASIESPLTTFTQKSKKFEWLEACERSFQILNDRLNFALVLTLPEGTKGFVLYFDEFRVVLGCVLMQYGKLVTYAYR